MALRPALAAVISSSRKPVYAKQNLSLPRPCCLRVFCQLMGFALLLLPPLLRAESLEDAAHELAPSDPPSGVHLFAWHYSSLSPRSELISLFAAYNLTEPSEVNVTGTDHEQLYARERRVLEDRRVLPLIVQAESVALGVNVRDWMPARWGEWHLADVWLELPEPATADPSNTGNSAVQALPQPRPVAPGAKP